MSDTDDTDPDLALAIAMSLEGNSPDPTADNKSIGAAMHSSAMIDLTDDEPKTVSDDVIIAPSSGKPVNPSRSLESGKTGLAVLDRKQMEAERLARQAKRNGDASRTSNAFIPVVESSHIAKLPESKFTPPRAAKRRRLDETESEVVEPQLHTTKDDRDRDRIVAAPSTVSSNSKGASSRRTQQRDVIDLSSPPGSPLHPQSASLGDSTDQLPIRKGPTDDLEYPNGVVRRTWAFKQQRIRDIKIEEVLHKATLKVAVVSSFQWDWPWLLSKLIPGTKLIMVMQAKEEETQEQYRNETKDIGGLRLVFPPMPGQVNCMHSKLMLLFYQHHLRIVIPTGNLVPYDWGEGGVGGGVMENTVFLIDLPRLDRQKQHKADLPQFGQSLLEFLESMTLSPDVIDGVLKFDFSKTKGLAFVHTIGGTHFGDALQKTGYFGLNRAIRTLGMQSDSSLQLDLLSSSIGSLTEKFLSTIYLAAQGAILPADGKITPLKLASKFRIFFPTNATVERSIGGPGNGGTINLQKKWWEAPTFPRSLFHDHHSVRRGLLSHSKIIFARGLSSDKDGAKPLAWAYVGSANLSESAWGKTVIDSVKKEPKLNCRNWECGVVVPISDDRIAQDQATMVHTRDPGDLDEIDENEDQKAVVPSMEVFSAILDVPMEWPGELIGTRRPWFFNERR